jgi:hypothetical protein
LSVAAIFVTVVAPPAHARCHVANVAAIPIAIDNNQLLARGAINNTQLRVAQLGKYQTMVRIGSRIPVAAVPEPGMLLGMDFLRSHRILVDNATRKMVFTYEGGPVFQISD